MQDAVLSVLAFLYKRALRPLLFRYDAEFIHEKFLSLGRFLGKSPSLSRAGKKIFSISHPSLTQEIAGVHFENPIGLAAGFDYQGYLPSILPSVGLSLIHI